MILEPITGVQLHCSRCNTIFQDPETETDAYWRDADEVRESFRDLGDCCGWRKFGDRIVCKECQTTDADGDPCERPDPLPAGEEDKVLRAQMRYMLTPSPANPPRHVGYSMSAMLQLLDDIRQRVADAREFAADLIEQLRDQGPASRNPYVQQHTLWTPENWREAKDDSARRFRQGVTSCAWFEPAGLEIRIKDVPECNVSECCWCRMCRSCFGDLPCGPWAARGQYHWRLANVRALPEPVPCKGALGLWTLPDDVEAAVAAQLGERANA